MKKQIKMFLLLSSLSVCSCSFISNPSSPTSLLKDDEVQIGYFKEKKVTINNENNYFKLEIGYHYSLDLYTYSLDNVNNEDFYKEIQFDYNHENVHLEYNYFSENSRRFLFTLYADKLSTDNEMKISYQTNGTLHSFSFKFDVIDYDFESRNVSKPLLSDIESHKEVQELLNSISYYTFQEPYIGLSGYGGSSYSSEYDYMHYFEYSEDSHEYTYDTDYLKYLTDSVYYPASFSMVNENSIADRFAKMVFDNLETIKEGSKRSLIGRFEIEYYVIDPGCTNPQYPLHRMSFSAVPKNYTYKSKSLKKRNDQFLNEPYFKLQSSYPEKYLEYNVGQLAINVIKVNNSFEAYFDDENYTYHISFYYVSNN